MPELPEVETARRGLAPVMEGARFARVELRRRDLRWPIPKDFAKRLEGTSVTKLRRRAKYLIAELSSGDVLLMHMGMSGSFRLQRNGEQFFGDPRYFEIAKDQKHDHVVFHMSSGARIAFNDPRRFGLMKLLPGDKLESDKLIVELGPEPLEDVFDAAVLAKACAGKKTGLKAALMDQQVVAGLGNIYACEALHRAHLSPKRIAATIADKSGAPNERGRALVAAIKAVLREAIEAGGATLRDHMRPEGRLGDFQHRFRVYDRAGEPCLTRGCSGRIKRIVQGARSTFFCPVCQK